MPINNSSKWLSILWILLCLACNDEASPGQDADIIDVADASHEDISEYDLVSSDMSDMDTFLADADVLVDMFQPEDMDMEQDLSEMMLPELTPPGGEATISHDPATPFLQFAPNLPLSELRRASLGRELFVADWTAAPGNRELLDGLGPLFVAQSCLSCHPSSGQAPTLTAGGGVGVGILFRLGVKDSGDTWSAEPTYGAQLQNLSFAGVPSEGVVRWSASEDSDSGLQHIDFKLENASYGEPLEGTVLGPRRSPSLVGMGLLDAIDEDTIRAWEDPEDLDGDGISGRAHQVWDVESQSMKLGRFGWKAIHTTLKQQTAGALSEDMGLTSPIFPEPNCRASQTACLDAPSGGSPEVSHDSLESMSYFLLALGVPDREVFDEERLNGGRALFHQVGCAGCHRPSVTTGSEHTQAWLNHQTIWPYTDLLLHDMGENLADIQEGDAGPSEWRTPPLWSLRFIASQPDARFLHDGRARTVNEAILWHGGEASEAQQGYRELSEDERSQLIDFLMSI